MIERFIISRDDALYEAFPDVALTASGNLVCIFVECTSHGDRSYSRVMLAISEDRGRTWTPKRPLSDPLRYDDTNNAFWNCPRISALSDGRLVAICDRVSKSTAHSAAAEQSNWLWFSDDEGESWDGPHSTPLHGIVPDKLIELKHGAFAGRWILSAHTILRDDGEEVWAQRCWCSDDKGQSWSGPYTVASNAAFLLCEGSIMELCDGALICFLRENSADGMDALKTTSYDGGATWQDLTAFPLPGCHRPVAGVLQSGKILITHRFRQGGSDWLGWWTQNFFAALTDDNSCRAKERQKARTRILPIEFDRSPRSDTGYSGWVQFPDGEIYIVNYIVDGAPNAHIRGYALRESDFLLQTEAA